MNDSHIEVNAQGRPTAYVGPDATNFYRARVLQSSLRLYAKTGMIPTRGVTATVLLKLAEPYTGKKYKRGQHEQAAADMDAWISTMNAALPRVEG